jgi:hypothetical protein
LILTTRGEYWLLNTKNYYPNIMLINLCAG